MDDLRILSAGSTPATGFAGAYLAALGYTLTDSPSPDVTHLLLDVPSFDADGNLRSGGDIRALLEALPPSVTVCGGKLKHPALQSHHTIDLLEDHFYLAENAYITAEAALSLSLRRLPCLLRDCPVLLLGWGRIGKCLAQLLKSMDARVTVAARKETDLATLSSLGYDSVEIANIEKELPRSRLIFNTVPHTVLASCKSCRDDCIKIDLASQPGMEGDGIITARGLPGIHKPESSGELIAKTLSRILGKEKKS